MSYIPGEEYWDLDPNNFKFNSYTWHRKYKLECFQMFNWHCSVCWEYIGLSDGVVHHKTYKHKGGIYQARPEEIADKICLMCHECHEKEHQNKSIDGVTKMLPKDTDGCNINSVSNYFHCQREEEMESKCTNQCDHCKEYYKPLEQ